MKFFDLCSNYKSLSVPVQVVSSADMVTLSLLDRRLVQPPSLRDKAARKFKVIRDTGIEHKGFTLHRLKQDREIQRYIPGTVYQGFFRELR